MFSVGAIFAQWNKVSGHLLATAHDGDVRLWDVRNGTAPVQYISAHLSNVSSLSFYIFSFLPSWPT